MTTDKLLNVLVFPCGSEIGLEIFRSLQYSRHIHLIGASSISDHGQFVYDDYEGNIPFITESEFYFEFKKLLRRRSIDIIYPTMDLVIAKLSEITGELPCAIVGSPVSTTTLIISKSKTYRHLKNHVPVPEQYNTPADIPKFPVFIKPDIGYGSRGTCLAYGLQSAEEHIKQTPGCILLEYLPGPEFTVDCFTDAEGKLIFSMPRTRNRITNGISVNSSSKLNNLIVGEIGQMAIAINAAMILRGSWFFQVKGDSEGRFKLLEVGARLAGSSSLTRAKGINFALLNIWLTLGKPIEILPNNFDVETDRALDVKYKLGLSYKKVYIDFDDTLVVKGKVNHQLVAFCYHLLNQDKKLFLITRHGPAIFETLQKYRLDSLFDNVIHVQKDDHKYQLIDARGAIFIDDSFAERKAVMKELKIPVFAPDAVEALF